MAAAADGRSERQTVPSTGQVALVVSMENKLVGLPRFYVYSHEMSLLLGADA